MVDLFICCQGEIQPNTYLEHLKRIEKERWHRHSQLSADEWFHHFETHLLKTKIVFANGLVLFRQNLIQTTFGNYNGFVNLAYQIYQSLEK